VTVLTEQPRRDFEFEVDAQMPVEGGGVRLDLPHVSEGMDRDAAT
jgi:hypothetical protein